MKRIGFLPVFFLFLGLSFAVAVFFRIRSYEATEEAAASPALSTTTDFKTNKSNAPDLSPNDPLLSAASPGALSRPTSSVRDYDDIPLLEPDPITNEAAVAAPQASLPPPSAPAPPSPPRQQAATAQPPRSVTVKPPSSTPPASAAPAPSSSSSDNRNPDPDQKPPAETDATSDSTAPQLLALEFAPTQIADGEETMLLIQATDDLSGVRSISGTILAPSGAVQGFACQREAETNRFVARVTVPKEAAEGVWTVNYINLIDNASNAAGLNAARGLPPSASFRVVSSRPDSTGPSLQSVWLDRRAMRGGEKNVVYVRATDDRSGVNLVSGIFQSPSKLARIGFVCRGGADELWTCEMSAPNCADCGLWQLEQVQMQDKAHNMTTVRAGQNEMVGGVRLDIASETCDASPPQMESLVLDRKVVSNADQSTIGVTVRLSDDACGVLSVSGQASGPQGHGAPPRLYFSFAAGTEAGTWTGRLVVPRLAAKGVWRVSFMQLLDRGQNLRTYNQNDAVLAGGTFVVN